MAKLITRIAQELIDENLFDSFDFGIYGTTRYGVSYALESVSAIVQAKVRTLKPATCGILAHQSTSKDLHEALPDWVRHGHYNFLSGRLTLEILTESAILAEIFHIVDDRTRLERNYELNALESFGG